MLLRAARLCRTQTGQASPRTACGVLFTRLVVSLTSSHHATKWDVASLALDKIASLLRSLGGELPELVPLLQLFGPPHHATVAGANQNYPEPSSLQTDSESVSPVFHGARSTIPPPNPPVLSPSVNVASPDHFDPLWWMSTDILRMPEHFEALPAGFDVPDAGAQSFDLQAFLETGAGGSGLS